MTKLLFLGETWGEQEEIYHHAFVGSSGKELASWLAVSKIAPYPLTNCKKCGLVSSEKGYCPSCKRRTFLSEQEMIMHWARLSELGIEVANVFDMRPEIGNNLDSLFSNDGNRDLPPLKKGQYVKQEYVHHIIKLWEKIRHLSPNLIVALGNGASWATVGRGSGITLFRGTLHTGFFPAIKDQKILPTFHPSYILRGGEPEKVVALADLDKAKREMTFPEIHRVKRWLTMAEDIDEIAAWLNEPAEFYANDIESGYALFSRAEIKNMTAHMRLLLSSQISIISFARSSSEGLVIQFMDRNSPTLRYWPKSKEVEAWRLVRQGLKKPIPKIFQNGLYDIARYLEIGIVPTMCYEDTMIRHHALYPELRKSLGFLASIYLDEIAWKQAYANREQLKREE